MRSGPSDHRAIAPVEVLLHYGSCYVPQMQNTLNINTFILVIGHFVSILVQLQARLSLQALLVELFIRTQLEVTSHIGKVRFYSTAIPAVSDGRAVQNHFNSPVFSGLLK